MDTGKRAAGDRPNFIVVLTDDLGFGDLGCYGASDIATEHLDRMAAEGLRFTSFCVAAPTCTPSRAALLTGCYPPRVGLPAILMPWARTGLGDSEKTIADVLKGRGYATACIGKWHLGHHREFLPTRHGFDEYFGLPYSNDMWSNHPVPRRAAEMLELPLFEGEEVIELNPDQTQLTTQYTERALSFIEKYSDRPFFLYLAHTMPHVPLHVSSKFAGKSGRGLYGDVIMEIDWSVGQILEALKRKEIEENTLVLFTSDNGPWIEYGNHGGSAGPLREGKWTTFDGGQRVPAIMRWRNQLDPGKIIEDLVSTIDLLPTFANLAGAPLANHPIDGQDAWPLLSGKAGGPCPGRLFLHYRGLHLEAVRQGRWKLHFPHTYKHLVEAGADGKPGTSATATIGLELFDLESDLGERIDVASQHPEIVARLALQGREANRHVMEGRRIPGEVEMDGVVQGGRLFKSKVDGGVAEVIHVDGGREHLRWQEAGTGAMMHLGLPVPATAAFEISVAASGTGKFKLTISGEELGVLEPSSTETLVLYGVREVPRGVRRLLVEVMDTDGAGTATLEIRFIRLEIPH